MAGRPFTDVLDDALGGSQFDAPARVPTWRFTAPPPGPASFGPIRTGATPVAQGRAAYELAAALAPVRPVMPRPVHQLTPPQRDAVAALSVLGAALSPAFDAAELRSSYRSLARRLHPDRHQASSAFVRARLARDFAAATTHYQTLLTLFPRH